MELIENVSDTAWPVATMRALESERPDALFSDPLARVLVGDKGLAMEEMISAQKNLSWPLAVRTMVIDEFFMKLVHEAGIDCILNLACGLCTRPYRLPLTRKLKWIDVDLPGVIEHREKYLARGLASCQIEQKVADLSNMTERQAILEKCTQGFKKVLVITEGLLPYLAEENVVDLSSELKALPQIHFWITDFYRKTKFKSTQMQDWNSKMGDIQQLFRFNPQEGSEYFTKLGWNLLGDQEFEAAGRRLGRISRFGLEIDPNLNWCEEAKVLLLAKK